MQLTPAAILQILILTVGIYLVLGFLRTTRGGGLLRGLVVAILVVVAGLAGLARYFELAELSHIIDSFTGFAVVILAILFQPELRRGLSHLGENPLVGRLIKSRRSEVLTEIAQAAITMANKRQGALIAFERKIALDAFIEGGVKVDAEVNRFLIDSLFHHGSALHDGAVIIRGDRIAAATSLFPLTENVEISKSTGTRHRAALGLTEETDAITIAVSEETGSISVCRAGKIERRVPPAQLEDRLRALLGSDEGSPEGERRGHGLSSWLRRLVTVRLGQKLAAFSLAVGIFWVAYQDIRETHEYTLEVTAVTENAAPVGGVLSIVLPDESYHVVEPQQGAKLQVEATGTRAQLEQLAAVLGGVLFVSPDDPMTSRRFPLDAVRWGPGRFVDGLEVGWVHSPGPQLEIGKFEPRTIQLEASHVPIDEAGLSARYRVDLERLRIVPSTVEVVGPSASIGELDTSFRLEPVALTAKDTSDRVVHPGLAPELRERGFRVVGKNVEVTIPIVPQEQNLGTIDKEITLVRIPGPNDVYAWEPPFQTATFNILSSGLIDADPGSPGWIEQSAIVTRFVEDNLRVYVNVAEADESSRRARIRHYFLKDWRSTLPLESTRDPRANLNLDLEGESELLLIQKSKSESEASAPERGAGGDG